MGAPIYALRFSRQSRELATCTVLPAAQDEVMEVVRENLAPATVEGGAAHVKFHLNNYGPRQGNHA